MAVDEYETKKQLTMLPDKASVVFAYRCALRALPLLADPGNFDYWGEDQDKHLFAIFHALDGVEGLTFGFRIPVISASTASAVSAAFAFASAYYSAAYAAAYAADTASVAVTVAASAASTAVRAETAFRNSKGERLSKIFEQMVASDLDFLEKKKTINNL